MKKSELRQIIREEIQRLTESSYVVYHTSFTDAADEARWVAKKKGYEVDEDSWWDSVALGGGYKRGRPGTGKTHKFHVDLLKNGKPQRKRLHFQVYGMPSGKYELNAYVQ